MWSARAGFPPGTRAQKNALLAPNHAQRLGAFLLAIVSLRYDNEPEVTRRQTQLTISAFGQARKEETPGWRAGFWVAHGGTG